MARLIEIDKPQELPARILIDVGDVLLFKASGGRVRSGATAVETLGPFIPGLLGNRGEILSPMGAPNTILFVARHPGHATIDVITGDPWRKSRSTVIDVDVEP
jgi:hypothetical protein